MNHGGGRGRLLTEPFRWPWPRRARSVPLPPAAPSGRAQCPSGPLRRAGPGAGESPRPAHCRRRRRYRPLQLGRPRGTRAFRPRGARRAGLGWARLGKGARGPSQPQRRRRGGIPQGCLAPSHSRAFQLLFLGGSPQPSKNISRQPYPQTSRGCPKNRLGSLVSEPMDYTEPGAGGSLPLCCATARA